MLGSILISSDFNPVEDKILAVAASSDEVSPFLSDEAHQLCEGRSKNSISGTFLMIRRAPEAFFPDDAPGKRNFLLLTIKTIHFCET